LLAKTKRNRAPAKAGLAGRIRTELKTWTRPGSRSRLCRNIGVERGQARQVVNQSLRDFERRGEITRTPSGLIKYNHGWRRSDPSPLKDKILRAMYVQGRDFSSTDIRRLVADAEKSHVEKTIRMLLAHGHLQRVGRRLCAHGIGAEWLYNIPDRVRFRVDVMR